MRVAKVKMVCHFELLSPSKHRFSRQIVFCASIIHSISNSSSSSSMRTNSPNSLGVAVAAARIVSLCYNNLLHTAPAVSIAVIKMEWDVAAGCNNHIIGIQMRHSMRHLSCSKRADPCGRLHPPPPTTAETTKSWRTINWSTCRINSLVRGAWVRFKSWGELIPRELKTLASTPQFRKMPRINKMLRCCTEWAARVVSIQSTTNSLRFAFPLNTKLPWTRTTKSSTTQ